MKLLFDENLASSLAQELADLYPESSHIIGLGLVGASDRVIWSRAAAEGFVFVTKDEDFHRLSVLHGAPPKVVWIRIGNCTTTDVAQLLRLRADEVRAFVGQSEATFLELG